MPKKARFLITVRSMAAAVLLFCSILLWSHAATGSQLESANNLLITEVYYDTPGVDADEEWIELANLSDSEIGLTDFKIGDEESRGGGEGMMLFPQGASIKSGETIIIALKSTGFEALFGRPADYEVQDSSPSIPDLVPYRSWASGDLRLANDGDEVLLLDAANNLIDLVVYGDSSINWLGSFSGPSVASVYRGQSIERAASRCDTNTALDWQPNRSPSPGVMLFNGDCRPSPEIDMINTLSIGSVQGQGNVSPFINQIVSVRGIVTGVLEDRNEQGAIFYSFFMQDLPGFNDNDPSTSDGFSVFTGTGVPEVALGDIVVVRGKITEFYGMTEMDDAGLLITIVSRGNTLPETIQIEPPPGEAASQVYLESFEGMVVGIPAAAVLGPTHDGCGFEVVRQDTGVNHIHHRDASDLAGYIIGALHPSDVNCAAIPSVNSGDIVFNLEGPLTYHFDNFKIVYQDPSRINVHSADLTADWQIPHLAPNQISVVSFNLDDYFDNASQVQESGGGVYGDELSARSEKVIYAIEQLLRCPTVIGIQEVENEELLVDLASALEARCGFLYRVSHVESPDARGIDVAMMTDPHHTSDVEIALDQVCTEIQTDVIDPPMNCPYGTFPLFSRPPLYASFSVDGEPLVIIINHFKSKRGGEDETAVIRSYQAMHVANMVKTVYEKNGPVSTIVLGDFNDYAGSSVMEILTTETGLIDALHGVPESQRYSYIFDGRRQLIDWIFVSPPLETRVARADIVHVNSDYSYKMRLDTSREGLPFRSSDHDIPMIVLKTGISYSDDVRNVSPPKFEDVTGSEIGPAVDIELSEEWREPYKELLRFGCEMVVAGLDFLSQWRELLK